LEPRELSVPAKDILPEDAVVGVLGVFDREAGSSHHRLEEPAERRVFVTDVFLEFGTAPSAGVGRVASGTPGLDPILRVGRVEVIDDIPKPEQASRSENASDWCERDTLPEIREMVEGIAGASVARHPRRQPVRKPVRQRRRTGQCRLRCRRQQTRM